MLDDAERGIVGAAWWLSLDGHRFVPEDDYLDVCNRLVRKGWLERELNDNHDFAYAFSAKAEQAFTVSEPGMWN